MSKKLTDLQKIPPVVDMPLSEGLLGDSTYLREVQQVINSIYIKEVSLN